MDGKTKSSTQSMQPPAPAPPAPAPPAQRTSQYESAPNMDFSLSTVPQEWVDVAQPVRPSSRKGKPRSKAKSHLAPDSADVFTGSALALIVSVITGFTWYFLERVSVDPIPWMALAVAMAISISVRVAGGPGSPDVRAITSAVFYLSTVVITAIFISRYQYLNSFNQSPNMNQIDAWVVRTRLEDAMTMGSWVLGFILSILVSYRLGKLSR